MVRFIWLVLILDFLSGCRRDIIEPIRDDEGVIIRKKIIWTVKLDDGDPNSSGFSINPSIVNNSQILLSGTLHSIPHVWSIDTKSGRSIWDVSVDFAGIQITNFYRYSNQIINRGGKGGYIINFNASDGTVIWKSKIGINLNVWITGLDSLFFLSGYVSGVDNPYKIYSAWIGNASSGNIEPFYTPEMINVDTGNLNWNGIGGVDHIVPTYSENGDLLTLLFINRYSSDSKEDSSYFNLFNYSKKEWLYRNKSLYNGRPEVVMGNPLIIENKVVVKTNYDLYCIDIVTGNRIWKTNYNDMFSWSGPCIANDKVFAVIEGHQCALVCHNLETGARLWYTPVTGLVSNIEYLNEVVYFASMSNGCLYAVDANNGKLLWKIRSEDGDDLKPECAAIPGANGEIGKIIVSSFLHGYCYEAER